MRTVDIALGVFVEVPIAYESVHFAVSDIVHAEDQGRVVVECLEQFKPY